MIIRLSNFKEDDPVAVHQEYDPKALDLEFVDLKYVDALVLDGTVEKGQEALVFEGRMVADVEHLCGRCLSAVREHVDQPFKLFYDIKNKDSVDTTDDLRELLILNHPISFVCREDCQVPKIENKPGEQDSGQKAFTPLKKIWEKMKEEKKNGAS